MPWLKIFKVDLLLKMGCEGKSAILGKVHWLIPARLTPLLLPSSLIKIFMFRNIYKVSHYKWDIFTKGFKK